MQAAFKRAPATSLSSSMSSDPGASDAEADLDWAKIKPEDKTLAHQVWAAFCKV